MAASYELWKRRKELLTNEFCACINAVQVDALLRKLIYPPTTLPTIVDAASPNMQLNYHLATLEPLTGGNKEHIVAIDCCASLEQNQALKLQPIAINDLEKDLRARFKDSVNRSGLIFYKLLHDARIKVMNFYSENGMWFFISVDKNRSELIEPLPISVGCAKEAFYVVTSASLPANKPMSLPDKLKKYLHKSAATKISSLLIKHPALLDFKNKNKKNLLSQVVRHIKEDNPANIVAKIELLSYIVRYRPQFLTESDCGHTVLMTAARRGYDASVSFLAAHCSKLLTMVRDDNKQAIDFASQESTKQLLQQLTSQVLARALPANEVTVVKWPLVQEVNDLALPAIPVFFSNSAVYSGYPANHATIEQTALVPMQGVNCYNSLPYP